MTNLPKYRVLFRSPGAFNWRWGYNATSYADAQEVYSRWLRTNPDFEYCISQVEERTVYC